MEFRSVYTCVLSIITDISDRYSIPISELRDRYIEKRTKCEGLTAKGTQCSNNALDGKLFCKCHARVKKSGEKKKKEKRVKKTRGEILHTHRPDEFDDTCKACKCFGDVRFIGVEIDSDILKRILEVE